MTEIICEVREEISAIWHNFGVYCAKPFSGFSSKDRYQAFCAAKDLIQDTGEALLLHRERRFSDDALVAYIEFWGVMQAINIQQDAISELEYAIFGSRLKHHQWGENWRKIRDLRDISTGHPAKKDRREPQIVRCVTGRETKSYDRIMLHFHSGRSLRHETLHLGSLMKRYEHEAKEILVKQKEA